MDDEVSVKNEPTIQLETLFSGKVVTLERHTVRLQNNRTSVREIIRHPGAVAILAEPSPDQVILVTQYRKGPDEFLLEVPAGKLEAGEDPKDCAARELKEETGFSSNRLETVYEFFTSPGFADEKIYLFYATDLQLGETAPDEDEFVETTTATREQVEMWLKQGKIRDAKTLVALLWWLQEKGSTPR